MRVSRLLSLIFVFTIACGKTLPELEGVDQKVWKNDRNGCKSLRSSMASAIRDSKHKLLALDELQIVSLLGKPDRNELFKRNQKFYYYFIDPAPECGIAGKAPLRLTIRFNAMGLAKEALIE